MKPGSSFEDIIRTKLNDHTPEYDPALWDKFESSLSSVSARKRLKVSSRFTILLSLGIIATILSLWLYQSKTGLFAPIGESDITKQFTTPIQDLDPNIPEPLRSTSESNLEKKSIRTESKSESAEQSLDQNPGIKGRESDGIEQRTVSSEGRETSTTSQEDITDLGEMVTFSKSRSNEQVEKPESSHAQLKKGDPVEGDKQSSNVPEQTPHLISKSKVQNRIKRVSVMQPTFEPPTLGLDQTLIMPEETMPQAYFRNPLRFTLTASYGTDYSTLGDSFHIGSLGLRKEVKLFDFLTLSGAFNFTHHRFRRSTYTAVYVNDQLISRTDNITKYRINYIDLPIQLEFSMPFLRKLDLRLFYGLNNAMVLGGRYDAKSLENGQMTAQIAFDLESKFVTDNARLMGLQFSPFKINGNNFTTSFSYYRPRKTTGSALTVIGRHMRFEIFMRF